VDPSPPTQADASPAPPADAPGALPPEPAGFHSRGRARRRARFLRKARELAYRDLGGLVFNLHRFGQRNDALVLAKLTTLGQIDTELRAIEGVLGESRPITVLREAGITACPRCAAIHSSEDSFCPSCGFSMRRHADLPIAGASALPSTPPAPPQPQPAPQPTPVPGDVPRTPVAAASAGGRSPVPPGAAASGTAAPSTDAAADQTADDQSTEILRPPVTGS
jgi:hypothetical protein